MKKLSELGVSPAPWKTDMRDDVEAANGIVMAYVSDTCELAEDEEKHNARLIAAAPELYEALKDAIEGLPMCTGECEDCWVDVLKSPCKKKEIFARARAALEKAGGA